MHPDVTLVEALHSRDLPGEAVITAARFSVAERPAQPGIDDLFDDLSQAAFALLDTTWSDPAERPRVERALDHVPGRLPVLDPYALAVLVLYGIFLLRKTERKVTRTFGDEIVVPETTAPT